MGYPKGEVSTVRILISCTTFWENVLACQQGYKCAAASPPSFPLLNSAIHSRNLKFDKHEPGEAALLSRLVFASIAGLLLSPVCATFSDRRTALCCVFSS